VYRQCVLYTRYCLCRAVTGRTPAYTDQPGETGQVRMGSLKTYEEGWGGGVGGTRSQGRDGGGRGGGEGEEYGRTYQAPR
jgi:hypothetical protein